LNELLVFQETLVPICANFNNPGKITDELAGDGYFVLVNFNYFKSKELCRGMIFSPIAAKI
jgi:hypothetical protein